MQLRRRRMSASLALRTASVAQRPSSRASDGSSSSASSSDILTLQPWRGTGSTSPFGGQHLERPRSGVRLICHCARASASLSIHCPYASWRLEDHVLRRGPLPREAEGRRGIGSAMRHFRRPRELRCGASLRLLIHNYNDPADEWVFWRAGPATVSAFRHCPARCPFLAPFRTDLPLDAASPAAPGRAVDVRHLRADRDGHDGGRPRAPHRLDQRGLQALPCWRWAMPTSATSSAGASREVKPNTLMAQVIETGQPILVDLLTNQAGTFSSAAAAALTRGQVIGAMGMVLLDHPETTHATADRPSSAACSATRQRPASSSPST